MKLRIVASLLVVGASLSAAACAGPSSGDQVIDTVFDACEPLVLVPEGASGEEEAGVADAVRLWNERAGTALVVDGDGAASDGGDGAPRLPVKFDEAAGAFHGHYDDENALIYINHDLAGRGRVITIAHEVGHAFGLMHVPAEERASLMNSGNMTHEVTDGDVDALAALWGDCPAE